VGSVATGGEDVVSLWVGGVSVRVTVGATAPSGAPPPSGARASSVVAASVAPAPTGAPAPSGGAGTAALGLWPPTGGAVWFDPATAEPDCDGVSAVRLPPPTGKNVPPEINVAMMPAITATNATPIRRSGQLRRSQSMIPILQARPAGRASSIKPCGSVPV